MCQISSSAWTAQNHRPQMPQWDVAAESQGSAIGEMACQRDDLPKCFPSGIASVRWTLLLIHPRNAIDLDFPSRPQHGLNGCTHREIVFEKFPVHLVHGVKVFQVRKKNRDLDYILKAAVGLFQNVRDVGQLQARFRLDVPELHLLGFGIYGSLSGHKNKATRNDPL
jgi:hypothetical protein